ncbi:MAG: ribose-phosphate pyrophosphokinase [Isosphaeraceae bacterium]|nr:ribose-phosphate pyrophosphokinase [Isosphaeraceae bacterium]
MTADWLVFSGTSNPALAMAIARELDIHLGARSIERFPDGEVAVRVDQPVRGRSIFLVQPTAPPVDENLIELLALTDACRRAAAARVTAIVPYFGYGRSDKRHAHREPITASLIARLVEVSGVDHLVVIDLHTPQIEGFFHIPVDVLTAVPTLCEALRSQLPPGTVVVAPDAGRVKMATRYAERLGAPLAVLHKRRTSGTETAVTHLVGDVRDRACLVIDDMISTGGTIAESVAALQAAGARPGITVAATHGLLVAGARERLDQDEISGIFVTDTITSTHEDWPRLHTISVAPLLATAIRRLAADGSLSDLF